MRYLLRTVVLALALGAGAALPAAAEPGGSWNWSDGGPRHFYRGEQAAPRRAVRHHGGSHYAARHHRRSYASARRSPHRHVAHAVRGTRAHHIARRHGHANRVAQHRRLEHKRTVTAAKPAPAIAPKPPTEPSRKSASGGKPHVSGQQGVASYYWEPQRVASGGWFNPNAMTAAHKTLPFGTRVRVTHLGNGRSVEVRINDRGPYVGGRIIDLSKAAASVLGMTGQGIARVAVEVLGR